MFNTNENQLFNTNDEPSKITTALIFPKGMSTILHDSTEFI